MTRGSCDVCGVMGASDVSEHTGIHEASVCSRCEVQLMNDARGCIEWDALDIATISNDHNER